MTKEIFISRLLPDLQFIADIPSIPYTTEVIAQIRTLEYPKPTAEQLTLVAFSEQTIQSFDQQTIPIRVYQPVNGYCLVSWRRFLFR